MKEAVYKLFTAGLTVLIFWGMLHSMNLLSRLNDYGYTKRAAEKNSGLAAAGNEIPTAEAKAPAEEMRTEPAPITAEDLSYIYIDGIKIDFPCTLADIREHFETKRYAGSYDEKKSKYTGAELLMKNGVCSYLIGYTSDSRNSPPEECTVTSIAGRIGHIGKYAPQFTAAGMDIVNISAEEFMRLSTLDEKEYLASDLIIFPCGNDGYTALNFTANRIAYYEKDDPEDMKTLSKPNPKLIKTELRLPENYTPENVSERKEELKEFALEYAASVSDKKYGEEIEKTVTEHYSTAYEFLAAEHDGYSALFYDLTYIEGLSRWEFTDDGEGIEYYDTGYLKIKGYCGTKREEDEDDYPFMVSTELLLKAGDRLGDALIIKIDT